MAKRASLETAKSLNFSYENVGHANSIFEHHAVDEFSQTFDYCIVFPMKKIEGVYTQTDGAKYVCGELLAAGLEIWPYYSVQDDELLVLIRCPVL